MNCPHCGLLCFVPVPKDAPEQIKQLVKELV